MDRPPTNSNQTAGTRAAGKAPPLLLGLDLGTTNAKAAVYDLQGFPQAEVSVSYPTYFPRPGWAEQHPADWTNALTEAVRAAAGALGSRVHDLAGIGLSAHGSGLLLVDDQGHSLLEACPTWQDERCTAQGRQLQDRLGALWPGVGSPLHNFPPKLLWAIEHFPDAAGRARYALGIKDFIVYWLTGQIATEPSSGPGAAAWPEPVFAACGWSMDRLPPVLSPTSRVGHLRGEVAQALGLPAALPVVIGLNDGASATLATGAVRVGEAVITLSTNGVLRVVLDAALPAAMRIEQALFNWPYCQELWIAGGQTRAGASALNWFAQVVSGPGAGQPLDQLLSEAAHSPPGSRGVLFLPYLMGRGSPHSDPAATGAFTGLTFACARGDLVRAVLEGTAFALREILDDLRGLVHPASWIRFSGGGGRSALWREIIAAALAQPLMYYRSDSTLGAAIVAAVGLGLYSSFEEAVQMMVHPADQTQPTQAGIAVYAGLYESFQRLRDRLFPRS